MNFRLSFILWLFLLSGCASKEALVLHQAKVDFNQFTSYSLFERSSTFTEQQNISDILRNSIELAIEKEFDNQGFTYQEPTNADVMVAYVLTGIEVIKPFNSTGSLNVCPGCGTSGNGSQGKNKKSRKGQYPNPNASQQRRKSEQLARDDNARNIGALLIDILDAKTLRSLWKGEYPLNAKSENSSKEVQDKITLALNEMMKLYPTNVPAN